jgi:hypothetical protein
VEEVVAVTLGAADHAVDEFGGGPGEAGAWDVCELSKVSVPASPRCGSRGRTVGPVGRGRQLVREAANDLGVTPNPTRRVCLVPRRRQSDVQLGDQGPGTGLGVFRFFFRAARTSAWISKSRS